MQQWHSLPHREKKQEEQEDKKLQERRLTKKKAADDAFAVFDILPKKLKEKGCRRRC